MSGRSCRPDPRIHAYRCDVADIRLAARVFAPHYAAAETAWLVADAAMLRAAPNDAAPAVSQLVHGERFEVLELAGGWAWGQCGHDDYVGYLPADALGVPPAATHRVTAPLALLFASADIKARVVGRLPIGSLIAGEGEGAFVRTTGGFVHGRHLAPLDEVARDPAAVAESLLGQPYLWGGRGGGGIDCSGLVQVSLGLAGIGAPRDSDMQRAFGEEVPPDAPLRRGDIVCFPGHVGLMVDAERLIHANAHWMAVTVEPLAEVLARMDKPVIVAQRRVP